MVQEEERGKEEVRVISDEVEEHLMYGRYYDLLHRTHHNGDGDSLDDLLDHGGVGHPSHTSLHTDVGRHSLQSHDGAGTSLLGDAGLLNIDDILGGGKGSNKKVKHVSFLRHCLVPSVHLLLLLPPAQRITCLPPSLEFHCRARALTMITPPLSICASPLFTPNVPKLEEPEAEPFVSGRWEPVREREMGARCASAEAGAGAGEPLPLMMVGCSEDMLVGCVSMVKVRRVR